MPSPFQTIQGAAEGGGQEATPVHHESIRGPLSEQVREHEDALKGYMGRLSGGQTLAPDEYHDYETRLKEHGHDSMLLQRLDKQHGEIKRKGNTLMREHRQKLPREQAEELLNQSGGR